jgi:diguanylate cyclase (GGDEF)-like protein
MGDEVMADKKDTKTEYLEYLAYETRKQGRQLASIGLPCLSFVTVIDFIALPNLITIYIRLGISALFLLFLLLNQIHPRLSPSVILILHFGLLLAIILATCGITVIEFAGRQLTPPYLIARSATRLLTTAFILSCFSVGLRQYLHFFLAIPITFIIVYAGFFQKLDWITFSLLINPAVVILMLLYFNRDNTRRQIRDFVGIRRMQCQKNKLYFEASRDELTNLYNRRVAYSILEKYIAVAKETNTPLTVGFVDVDRLKLVNDTHGHAAGDNLLRKVADSLLEYVRNSDYICRLGGDEFLLIYPGCDLTAAEKIVEKIRKNLNVNHNIDFSYGLATYQKNSHFDVNALIDAADRNMYRDKVAKTKAK